MKDFLLVLGGNKLACNAITQLEKKGYSVLVLDKNPSELVHKVASEVLIADFFNTDETLDALKSFSLCGVMALNDFGVYTAAKIVKERNLFGYSIDAALNVTEKTRMKDCWAKNNILTARYKNLSLEDIQSCKFEWNIFPCILKPSFAGGGSRGVYYAENINQLLAYLKQLSALYPHQEAVVEEYIEGTEHTIEVLVANEQTHLMSISDKKNYPGSKTIVQNLWFPGPKGNLFRTQLEKILNQACKSLGLTYGCAHFEIMITPNNDIYLIEVGGRPGGGLNFHPISQLSTGYDYPAELASILTTGKPLLKKAPNVKKLMWHFFNPIEGIVEDIIGIEKIRSLPNVIDADVLIKIGAISNKIYANDLERPGYYLFSYESPLEVDPFIKYTDNLVSFRVK